MNGNNQVKPTFTHVMLVFKHYSLSLKVCQKSSSYQCLIVFLQFYLEMSLSLSCGSTCMHKQFFSRVNICTSVERKKHLALVCTFHLFDVHLHKLDQRKTKMVSSTELQIDKFIWLFLIAKYCNVLYYFRDFFFLRM